jgi:hypothetical protein
MNDRQRRHFRSLLDSPESRKGEREAIRLRKRKTTTSSQGREFAKETAMRKTLGLVLSVWAALPVLGRAQGPDETVLPFNAVPAGANGHVAQGGCPTCGHAVAHRAEAGCCHHDVRRPCLSRLLQWATYRPLPTSGCTSCTSCRSCGSGQLLHGCGGCCKQCTPCCNPPLYAYFVHRCPCNTPVHHYPEVYKTWDGKWPPAYAGPDDKAVLYTDEERLNP